MGQFSWITSDTEEQVFNDYGKRTVYLLVPEEWQSEFGERFEESDYEGYGIFGGRDAYALVAMWNRPDECKNADGTWKTDDECRMIGIGIACYDDDNFGLEYPIKITSEPMAYADAKPSKGDPNQGWHDESFDDDYYDEW